MKKIEAPKLKLSTSKISRKKGANFLLGTALAFVWVNPLAAEALPPLDCVINPYQVVDLASSVPGVLEKIYVDKSDFIERGEVAATLESAVERSSVVLAEARAAIQSEVQVSAVNLDFDGRRKVRMDALYAKKTVSIEIKDEAEREHSLSKWRLQQAKDLKGIRQLELLRAQKQLEQKTIRTPIAGFVLQRFKEAGEYVEDQPIMRIAQLDPLYVEAVVPIDLHGRISKDMRAQVYVQSSTTQAPEAYEARVSTVDKVGDASTGTYAIRLTLPNPDFQILAGVKCSIKFADGVVAAPASGQNERR